MIGTKYAYVAVAAVIGFGVAPAAAQSMFAGNWYLDVGGAVVHAPKFEGASSKKFFFQPIISFGRQGVTSRFVSRNDNISLALFDTGSFRAGLAGKLIFGRDSADHTEIKGVSSVPFGGELGVFAEVYPADFLRVRGEVRHGIRSHNGVIAEVAADAFVDLTQSVRLSAGPRVAWASQGYFDAWYGVSAAESAASGLAEYSPGHGFQSYGVGGALTWQTTDNVSTSVFAEYKRLAGPAENSSIVRQRGSKDQLSIGASATYRFNFSLQ